VKDNRQARPSRAGRRRSNLADFFSFAVQDGDVSSLGRWRIRCDLARNNRRRRDRFFFVTTVPSLDNGAGTGARTQHLRSNAP
jgi:hypothetical protein